MVSVLADQVASFGDVKKEEVWGFSGGGSVRAVLPIETWNALLLDRDQDGLLDDPISNLDALDIGNVTDFRTWTFSVATNFSLKDGTVIRDGDLFRFDGTGNVLIPWTEDNLALATSTSTVDVDALAIGAGGEIYFSFEDDEVTASPALIAQNGGATTLDEQTVFRLDPGQSFAVIQFTQAQVAAVFNQALGTSVTSVVDVVGLEMDPDGGPQDLWLTSGSTSQALRGRIVSSAQGGSLPTIAGGSFDPLAAAWSSPPTFDALAFGTNYGAPILRINPSAASSAAGGVITISAERLTPGTVLQLVASAPSDALGSGFPIANAIGFPFVALNVGDPFFWISLQDPTLRVAADATGTARYSFDVAGFPPSMSGVVQAITVANLNLSAPAAWTVLP